MKTTAILKFLIIIVMFILQSQLSQSQNKVDELTEELAMERSVTENAKVCIHTLSCKSTLLVSQYTIIKS